MRSVAIAAPLLLLSQTALALDPIPGEEQFTQMFQKPNETRVGAGLDFGMIGEDIFFTVTPRIDLNLGLFGLGLQAPINLRVVDNPPRQGNDFGGVIRKEDWDEPGEFLRVIRYLRFGNKRDLIYVRIGELVAEIGHGTIMTRYMNNTDVDTFRLGLQLDINTPYGGFESIISDVKMFQNPYADSQLVGGRVYVKPVAFWDPSSFLNIFSVGYTLLVDANSPYELAVEPNPQAPGQNRVRVNSANNFMSDTIRATYVTGFDVEAEVFNNALFELVPYVDLNWIVDGDFGFHAGINATVKVPLGLELAIPMKVEYRHFGPRYLPSYFNNFYELERLNWPIGEAPGRDPDGAGNNGAPGRGRPKGHVVRNGGVAGGGVNGYYAQAALDIAGYLQVGALYEDYGGSPGGTLAAFVSIPALDWLQAKAYYARTNIKDPGDLFALDERSIAVAQLRWEIISYVYLVGRWTRQWEIDPVQSTIVANDSWKLGFEVGYTF